MDSTESLKALDLCIVDMTSEPDLISGIASDPLITAKSDP